MTAFTGWGGAWGESWGPLTTDPNAMRGTARLTITATGNLTGLGDGFMVGAAGFGFAALGTLTAEGRQQTGGVGAPARVAPRPRAEVDRAALERAEIARKEAQRIAAEQRANEIADREAAEFFARLAEAERVNNAFRLAARQAEQAITAAMIRPTIDVQAMDAALQALRDAAARAKQTQNRERAAMLAAVLLLES